MFSVDHLNRIRLFEIERIVPLLPPGSRILEFGAGTGMQALELSRRGFDVAAIDVPSSNYARNLIFPVQIYDGRTIPFPDGSFDVVFSSNVLAHVHDLEALHAEFARVLKPGGFCIHVVPTHTWKIWTALTAGPDAALWAISFLSGRKRFREAAGRIVGNLKPRRLGEHGSTFSEYWTFRPQWWRQHFQAHGFSVAEDRPTGLLYTGNMLFGGRTSFEMRTRLARALGSSGHIFKVSATDHPDEETERQGL